MISVSGPLSSSSPSGRESENSATGSSYPAGTAMPSAAGSTPLGKAGLATGARSASSDAASPGITRLSSRGGGGTNAAGGGMAAAGGTAGADRGGANGGTDGARQPKVCKGSRLRSSALGAVEGARAAERNAGTVGAGISNTRPGVAPGPAAAAGAAGWDTRPAAWLAGGSNTPQAPRASGCRATTTGGGRVSVSDTSGSIGGGGAATRCAAASNTSLHCPQRTQPSEMRSWSATTLNWVAQAGQRVIWLICGRL